MWMSDYIKAMLFHHQNFYAIKVNLVTELFYPTQEWLVSDTATCFISVPKLIDGRWFDNYTEVSDAVDTFNDKHCIGGEIGNDDCCWAKIEKISIWQMIWWWLKMDEHDFEAKDKESSFGY